jgi:ABC-type transporter Mla MlaB component
MAIWSRPIVGFSVFGPIAVADLAGLQARLAERGVPAVVECTLVDVRADAVAVDALAQLTLCARRCDSELRVCNPSSELRELMALVGLEDVLEG